MTTKFKHPQGLAAVTLDGQEYFVNRYGCVFTPAGETIGYHNAAMEARQAVRRLVAPAQTGRYVDGCDPVYDLRKMRRLLDATRWDHRAEPEWDTSQHSDWCKVCGGSVQNGPEGWAHE